MKLSAPYKENHIALWKWLAANPKSNKADWPGFITMGRLAVLKPPFHCFLCAEFHKEKGHRHICACPLFDCVSRGGLFYKWGMAIGKERKDFALQIANCFEVKK